MAQCRASLITVTPGQTLAGRDKKSGKTSQNRKPEFTDRNRPTWNNKSLIDACIIVMCNDARRAAWMPDPGAGIQEKAPLIRTPLRVSYCARTDRDHVIPPATPCRFDLSFLSLRPHFPVISTPLSCHFDRREKSCAGGPGFLAALGMTNQPSFRPGFLAALGMTNQPSFRPKGEILSHCLQISHCARNDGDSVIPAAPFCHCRPAALSLRPHFLVISTTLACHCNHTPLSLRSLFLVISTGGRNLPHCPRVSLHRTIYVSGFDVILNSLAVPDEASIKRKNLS